jgi:hypothetical protein
MYVFTLHKEFRKLLGKNAVFLVTGVVRDNVNLKLGFIIRDTSQQIINWWNTNVASCAGNRSTKANLDKEEVTDTVELEAGEIIYHFSRRTDLVLRFIDRSGETVEINEYRLSICI